MEIRFSMWTDAELDEAILKLCDEFPDARVTACAVALEHCRALPRGTLQSLLDSMREELRRDEARRGPRLTDA